MTFFTFFGLLFMVIVILSQGFCLKSAERKTVVDEIFLYISLYWRCLTSGSNRGLTSNKSIHYPLDYGSINCQFYVLIWKKDLPPLFYYHDGKIISCFKKDSCFRRSIHFWDIRFMYPCTIACWEVAGHRLPLWSEGDIIVWSCFEQIPNPKP